MHYHDIHVIEVVIEYHHKIERLVTVRITRRSAIQCSSDLVRHAAQRVLLMYIYPGKLGSSCLAARTKEVRDVKLKYGGSTSVAKVTSRPSNSLKCWVMLYKVPVRTSAAHSPLWTSESLGYLPRTLEFQLLFSPLRVGHGNTKRVHFWPYNFTQSLSKQSTIYV